MDMTANQKRDKKGMFTSREREFRREWTKTHQKPRDRQMVFTGMTLAESLGAMQRELERRRNSDHST